MKFPFYKQLNRMDCGPTCLRMIAAFYGKHFAGEYLRKCAGFAKGGSSLLGIKEAAELIGFKAESCYMSVIELCEMMDGPAVLHWNNGHFIVLIKITKGQKYFLIADPAKGLLKLRRSEFEEGWLHDRPGRSNKLGVILFLTPTETFHLLPSATNRPFDWGFLTCHLTKNRRRVLKILITLCAGLCIQFVLPFATQSYVDNGIQLKDLSFTALVLLAQLTLVLSRTVIDFLRSRQALQLSQTINLSILSAFWAKLTRLPMSYFDTYHAGDVIQRLSDGRKIESFLSGTAVASLFSIFSLIVFGIVLFIYSPFILLVFLIGSLFYFLWVKLFMEKRRKLNYKSFYVSAMESNATLQLIEGMQELKLNGAEVNKVTEWERLQQELAQLRKVNLSYNQWQTLGAVIINQVKDFGISFLVACLVVNGELTIGAMLAIQYTVGQLGTPIESFVIFTQNLQDAKISVERLQDIHSLEEENPAIGDSSFDGATPAISVRNLSFFYPGFSDKIVLNDISFEIPPGSMTAIVGESGSGKTTMLKVLMNFYTAYTGSIYVNNLSLQSLAPQTYRKYCGAVLQDGFIFSDSISNNISLNDGNEDIAKLRKVASIANILDFIDSLPHAFHTRLGPDGLSISKGQKQRILIARALYREPSLLFLDEATNSLDANNEKIIVGNLNGYLKNRTVVVVAHRLSTIKNADQILFLKNGRITERGTHERLMAKHGDYYKLIENQYGVSSAYSKFKTHDEVS